MKTNVAAASIESMAQREKINSVQRARIVRLLRDKPRKMGWTNREIAHELNTNPKYRKNGDELNNHIDHSTVAARRNALANKGIVSVSENMRYHKLPDWERFARAHPVELA